MDLGCIHTTLFIHWFVRNSKPFMCHDHKLNLCISLPPAPHIFENVHIYTTQIRLSSLITFLTVFPVMHLTYNCRHWSW